jgi:hypothetical protein
MGEKGDIGRENPVERLEAVGDSRSGSGNNGGVVAGGRLLWRSDCLLFWNLGTQTQSSAGRTKFPRFMRTISGLIGEAYPVAQPKLHVPLWKETPSADKYCSGLEVAQHRLAFA